MNSVKIIYSEEEITGRAVINGIRIMPDSTKQVRTSDAVWYLDNNSYPKIFKWKSSWDSHCCGDYYEVHGADALEAIDTEIKSIEDYISELSVKIDDLRIFRKLHV